MQYEEEDNKNNSNNSNNSKNTSIESNNNENNENNNIKDIITTCIISTMQNRFKILLLQTISILESKDYLSLTHHMPSAL